jgi:hypothetical protein
VAYHMRQAAVCASSVWTKRPHACRPRAELSVRERSGKPEPWEHGVVEAGHGANPVAGEGEDEQAGPVADAAGAGAKVGPERRLTIRPRRHEVMRSAAEDAGAEAGHDVAALVFEGNWWHGDADIGGEQGDQRVDIAGLVRADEFATSACSAGEWGAGGGSRSPIGGRRRCRLARARLRALLTDSTVESSMSATSLAWYPSTSRKMSTARWRAGRTCSAVTKAREMASVCA